MNDLGLTQPIRSSDQYWQITVRKRDSEDCKYDSLRTISQEKNNYSNVRRGKGSKLGRYMTKRATVDLSPYDETITNDQNTRN
jgi:hypothetical protein